MATRAPSHSIPYHQIVHLNEGFPALVIYVTNAAKYKRGKETAIQKTSYPKKRYEKRDTSILCGVKEEERNI